MELHKQHNLHFQCVQMHAVNERRDRVLVLARRRVPPPPQVGASDIRDGILRNADLFFANANGPLRGVKASHAIALPIVLLGGYAFIYRSFLPWMQRTALESRRVAEMLSQVSPARHTPPPRLRTPVPTVCE